MIQLAKNSFQDGLILDFSPESTPATTMTSALNATLLTFNGNEMQLLGDMGNGRVETARLPDGYIPVGTCEFGDIIYIVSYNPIINKSQIGCFPSPERNISSEEVSSMQQTLSWRDFLEGEDAPNGTIKTSSVRKILYGEKYMNPGDKYIIYTDGKETLANNANVLSDFGNTSHQHGYWPKLTKIHVVSIEDSGKINYLDSTTKWYDKQTYLQNYPADYYIQELHEENGTAIPDIDSYRSLVSSAYSVFQSKVSGKLALLIELELITSFNCTYDIISTTSDPIDNIVKTNYNIYFYVSWETYHNDVNPSGIIITDSSWKGNIGTPEEIDGIYRYTYNTSIDLPVDSAYGDNGYNINQMVPISRLYSLEDAGTYEDYIENNSYNAKYLESVTQNNIITTKAILARLDGHPRLSGNKAYYYLNLDKIDSDGYKTLDSNNEYQIIREKLLTDDVINNHYHKDVCKLIRSSFLIPTKLSNENINYDLSGLIWNYSVAPCMPYGVLEHLKVNNSIDFSKINTGTIDLTLWRYYNSGTNSTLTWGLDVYPEPNKGVSEVVFEFYDNQGIAAAYHILNMNSYSGLFTENIILGTANSSYKLTDKDAEGKKIYHAGKVSEVGEVVLKKENGYSKPDKAGVTTDTVRYENDAGTLYPNWLYLVKIIVKYRTKNELGLFINNTSAVKENINIKIVEEGSGASVRETEVDYYHSYVTISSSSTSLFLGYDYIIIRNQNSVVNKYVCKIQSITLNEVRCYLDRLEQKTQYIWEITDNNHLYIPNNSYTLEWSIEQQTYSPSDKIFYRWYWTNHLFNDYYYNNYDFNTLSPELVILNELEIDGTNLVKNSKTYFKYNYLLDYEKDDLYKLLYTNITYINSHGEPNIKFKVKPLINSYNTFSINSTELEKYQFEVKLGTPTIECPETFLYLYLGNLSPNYEMVKPIIGNSSENSIGSSINELLNSVSDEIKTLIDPNNYAEPEVSLRSKALATGGHLLNNFTNQDILIGGSITNGGNNSGSNNELLQYKPIESDITTEDQKDIYLDRDNYENYKDVFNITASLSQTLDYSNNVLEAVLYGVKFDKLMRSNAVALLIAEYSRLHSNEFYNYDTSIYIDATKSLEQGHLYLKYLWVFYYVELDGGGNGYRRAYPILLKEPFIKDENILLYKEGEIYVCWPISLISDDSVSTVTIGGNDPVNISSLTLPSLTITGFDSLNNSVYNGATKVYYYKTNIKRPPEDRVSVKITTSNNTTLEFICTVECKYVENIGLVPDHKTAYLNYHYENGVNTTYLQNEHFSTHGDSKVICLYFAGEYRTGLKNTVPLSTLPMSAPSKYRVNTDAYWGACDILGTYYDRTAEDKSIEYNEDWIQNSVLAVYDVSYLPIIPWAIEYPYLHDNDWMYLTLKGTDYALTSVTGPTDCLHFITAGFTQYGIGNEETRSALKLGNYTKSLLVSLTMHNSLSKEWLPFNDFMGITLPSEYIGGENIFVRYNTEGVKMIDLGDVTIGDAINSLLYKFCTPSGLYKELYIPLDYTYLANYDLLWKTELTITQSTPDADVSDLLCISSNTLKFYIELVKHNFGAYPQTVDEHNITFLYLPSTLKFDFLLAMPYNISDVKSYVDMKNSESLVFVEDTLCTKFTNEDIGVIEGSYLYDIDSIKLLPIYTNWSRIEETGRLTPDLSLFKNIYLNSSKTRALKLYLVWNSTMDRLEFNDDAYGNKRTTINYDLLDDTGNNFDKATFTYSKYQLINPN